MTVKTAQKPKTTSQWDEALDLVSQGKSVWGEHAEIGEAVLRPGTMDGYVISIYPGPTSPSGAALAEENEINFARKHRFDFTILQVFDDADAAGEAIRQVRHWNLQYNKHRNGYRWTRQALPATDNPKRRYNKLIYISADDFEVLAHTSYSLPALMRTEARP